MYLNSFARVRVDSDGFLWISMDSGGFRLILSGGCRLIHSGGRFQWTPVFDCLHEFRRIPVDLGGYRWIHSGGLLWIPVDSLRWIPVDSRSVPMDSCGFRLIRSG